MELTTAAQVFINGLIASLIYLLVALGLTLVFSIMNTLNFAHGEMYMLGAFVTFYLFDQFELNYFPTLLIAALAVGFLGVFIEKVFIRPFRGNLLATLLVTLGLSLVITTCAMLAFGTGHKSVRSVFQGMLDLSGVHLPVERLTIGLISASLVLGLYFFIQSTKLGRAMRAVSQDLEASTLQGINIDFICSLGFGLSCALAAIAGALMVPIFYVDPFIGGGPLLKAFIIVILGGLGSIPGCIVGAVLLGMLESFGSYFVSVPFVTVISFLVVIILLLFRPTGLFGHAE